MTVGPCYQCVESYALTQQQSGLFGDSFVTPLTKTSTECKPILLLEASLGDKKKWTCETGPTIRRSHQNHYHIFLEVLEASTIVDFYIIPQMNLSYRCLSPYLFPLPYLPSSFPPYHPILIHTYPQCICIIYSISPFQEDPYLSPIDPSSILILSGTTDFILVSIYLFANIRIQANVYHIYTSGSHIYIHSR